MSWLHERARVAGLSRDRNPDDPELQDARQRLKAARLEEHVRKTVAAWPPLTSEQCDRIAILLRPASSAHATASESTPFDQAVPLNASPRKATQPDKPSRNGDAA